jgi:hypothetical protein
MNCESIGGKQKPRRWPLGAGAPVQVLAHLFHNAV